MNAIWSGVCRSSISVCGRANLDSCDSRHKSMAVDLTYPVGGIRRGHFFGIQTRFDWVMFAMVLGLHTLGRLCRQTDRGSRNDRTGRMVQGEFLLLPCFPDPDSLTTRDSDSSRTSPWNHNLLERRRIAQGAPTIPVVAQTGGLPRHEMAKPLVSP